MKNYAVFDNFLDNTVMKGKHSRQLESAMRKHFLKFPYIRDEEVENHQFTPFVYTFYDLVGKSGWIPFQSEFVRAYIAQQGDEFKDLYKRKREAVEARLMRCHPSYARDLHFAMKCRESGLFDDVIYNPDMDVKQGIDLLILKDCKFYGVHLFVDTNRGHGWRSKKNNRHSDPNKFVTEFDFTVYKQDGFKCGEYFLFGQDQVRKLYEHIVRLEESSYV